MGRRERETMNYIITEKQALELGIVDGEGNELEHSATERQIAAAAIAAETTFTKAQETAEAMVQDVYVIDEDGNSHYFGGALA